MMFPRILQRTALSSSSCLHCIRRSTSPRSSFTWSHSVSSPRDDKENPSVINDLLLYKESQLKKSEGKAKSKNTEADDDPVYWKGMHGKGNDKIKPPQLTKEQKDLRQRLYGQKYNSCYITGQEAADMLVEHLKRDLREGDVIAEAHLGSGVLTKTLLSQTSHNVIGYEPVKEFSHRLQSELMHYGPRLVLHDLNLINFYWYYVLAKREPEEKDKLALLLKPLPAKGDRNISPVKIVGSLIDRSFLKNLSLSFTFQCSLYKDIFPVLYIYLPNNIYQMLISESLNTNIMRLKLPFIYYFNMEHLGTVPISNFYANGFQKKKFSSKKNETFHLVKIIPKENAHEIAGHSGLPTFHYFMKSMTNLRKGRSFIYQVEKFIPGCGAYFIKNRFRMFTHPHQMSPDQLLEAYRLFVSLPSFEGCMFHEFCNHWVTEYGMKEYSDTSKDELQSNEDLEEAEEDIN